MNAKKLSAFALFILITVSIIPPSAQAAPFYYAGWLPFWKKQSGAQDISNNLYKFQELSPFSYEIKNGAIVDDLKLTEGFWPAWLSAIHDAGVKNIPTIAWFDGQGIQNLLSNKSKRIAQEDAIAKLVKTMGFDGIDIDYEGKLPETKQYFSTFIYGLAIRLHPMGKILSCTLESRTPLTSLLGGVPKDTRTANSYPDMNKYCDEVRIMAYDQGLIDGSLDRQKGNGTLYAPVADPDWVKKTIQEALKYISHKKIMLGIPTYGYEYEVSWSDGYTTYKRLRSFTFFQAINRALSVGAVQERNSAGEFSFTYATSTFIKNVSPMLTWQISSTLPAVIAENSAKGLNTMFVSFSDAESAAQKIALAKKMGLRGVAFFKLDGEQDPFLWDKMK
ncbi:MAG TPA: glycosyl hydrolase family 18 protein [Candidatus Paceibacterota bacterium]|nr:glycosyl hydrolase family 18 protein [Candidatus Paceibacterota bacterium]